MMLILIESEVWHIQKLPGPPAIFLYSAYSYTVHIFIQWIFLYSGYSYTVDILIQWIFLYRVFLYGGFTVPIHKTIPIHNTHILLRAK